MVTNQRQALKEAAEIKAMERSEVKGERSEAEGQRLKGAEDLP